MAQGNETAHRGKLSLAALADVANPIDPQSIEECVDAWCGQFDGDGYDSECKQRESENDRYLDEFYEDLAAAGLKEATIGKHIDNVYFYLNTYLLREAPLPMRAGCYKVDDFLGSFFIRKCMWSTPASIRSNAASYKKFYQSMLQRGHIAQGDYDWLVATIKDGKDDWCELCAEYNDPYSENPFFPFGGFEGDGGFGSQPLPLVDNSAEVARELGIAGPDAATRFGEMLDESADPMLRAFAQQLLSTALEQGMSGDELLAALDDVAEQLDRELAVFDASDDELLDQLEAIGLRTNREEFVAIVKTSGSESTVFDALRDANRVEIADTDLDFALTAIGELWERWVPEEPSSSIAFAQIVEGYEYDDGRQAERLDCWEHAWEVLKRVARLEGADLLLDGDARMAQHSLPEWLRDFEEQLRSAAEDDPAYGEILARYLEERNALVGPLP